MADQNWYEKHKKDVAVALKKGRSAAKDDGVPCTLVRMQDGSALLCANVSGSKAAALVKEAKGAGGKVLSVGTLYKSDDGPTFAVSDGSTSVKVLFSSAAAEAAGAPLNVIVVAVAPPGEAATAQAPPPAAPATPPPAAPVSADAKDQFTDLLRQVRPRYQQAIASDPPSKANLEKGIGMAVAAAKENDFSKGLKVLQALDVALQKTPTSTAAAPPPAPTAAVPPPPPAAPPATAAIQAALTKMIPLVKNAAAANPARKMELLDPLKRCQDYLKNNQAAEAKAALFDLNRVLKELNGDGAVPPGSPPVPPPPTPVREEESREEEGEEKDSDTAPTTEIKEGSGEKDEAKSTTGPEDDEETTTVGVWVKARDKVVAQMQTLQAALGKESQETGDPDFDLIADQGLAAITKRLQVGLHVALLEFDRAAGDARTTAATRAQKVVGEFQTFLESNGLVALAEENPWGVKVEIRSTLGAALDQLSKILSA